MHPINLHMSIHWHGAAQDYVLLLHVSPYCGSCPDIYMVKLKIIGCNPTWPGWHDWRFDGDYDGYDTVGKAIHACRKQRESLPWPWQWSIIVVEFDCRVQKNSFNHGDPERLWLSELTSEKPKIAGQIWGDVNAAQLFFLGGCEIVSPTRGPLYEF